MINIEMNLRGSDTLEGKVYIKGDGRAVYHETIAILKALHEQLPDNMFTDALSAMTKSKFEDLFKEGGLNDLHN